MTFITECTNLSNELFVPAIIISALLSVLMADIHRDLSREINFFDSKIKYGNILDRMLEHIIALFYAIVIILFFILIFVIVKMLVVYIINMR